MTALMIQAQGARRTLRLALVLGIALGACPRAGAAAQEATGSIEGTVVDAEGKPIPGILVAAVPASPASGEDDTRAAAKTRTRADGTFRLTKIPPGSYGVTATGGRLAAVYHDVLRLTSGGKPEPLRLVMKPEGIVVSGTVRLNDQAPAVHVEVRAVRYSNSEADVFYAESDQAGAYSIALPRARYLVQVVADGFDGDMKSTPADSGAVLDFQLLRRVPPGPAPPAVVDWIRAHAVPLRTVEAGSGFEDMEPIRAIVGNARLVSLGEATHGTREFFQLKHRMLEFLVERMGFTVFGIEATMPEGFDVNDYVLTGKGDPGRALSGLYFWTWDTQEVLDMIRWMRAYNADPAHARKVKFYGFDMQGSSRAARVVLDYLRRVDPELAAAQSPALAPLADPFRENSLRPNPISADHPAKKAAEEILRCFDDRKAAYVKRSSSDAWSLARQHARILTQNAMLRSGQFDIRDRAMAENIQWILDREGPGARMVAWAHNMHVATEVGAGMGRYLRATLGPDMVVFGFAFHRGSFQAGEMPFGSFKGVHPFTVGPAPPGSLDETLSRAGNRVAALDLRRMPAGPARQWFESRLRTRDIGAGFSDSLASRFLTALVPPRNYDALLFVDSTTSAVPNRARPQGTSSGARIPAAPAPDNLGFESDSPGIVPKAWVAAPLYGPGGFYEADVSGEHPRKGHRCARIRSVGGPRYGETFGTLYQRVDATPFRGKKVRLRASVRVKKGSEDASARLWIRVAKPGGMQTYDGMDNQAITSPEWREYEVVGEIPSDGSSIDFGAALVGTGTAWLDDVSIEPVP